IHEIFSPRGELVVEGPWPARARAIQVSRTQQKSLNASIARPNSPSASRIRRQSRVCMCKAPLPGYHRPPPHCRLGRRRCLSTYWWRWGVNWFKWVGRIRRLAPHGALTKVNEGAVPPGPKARVGTGVAASMPPSQSRTDAPDFGAMTYRRRAADPPVFAHGGTVSAYIAFQQTT